MMVIDTGISNATLLVSREPAEEVLGKSMADILEEIASDGRERFFSGLTGKFLGRTVGVKGRSINDDRGCMIQSENVEILDIDPVKLAEEVIARWEVVL